MPTPPLGPRAPAGRGGTRPARRREAEIATDLRYTNQQLLVASLRERELAAEAEAARVRASFLAEASAVLAASLDLDATLVQVAHLAVPRLADWCIIDLLNEDGACRRVAVAHAGPLPPPLVQELHGFPPDPSKPEGAARALRTKRTVVHHGLPDDLLEADPFGLGSAALVRRLGLKATVHVPMAARDRTSGVITLATAESGRRFGAADIATAEELARQAAVAAENARLFREAQEAVRARDAFLARTSHELRTPLTSAFGTIRLVNNLLDASKLAVRQEPLALTRVDLRTAVAHALDIVGAQGREKGVRLSASVPPALAVSADPVKLEQVLVNLLADGVKFTPAGGSVTVEAQASPDDQGQTVVLRVRDTGEGIAAEHLERVFEPFFQVAPGPGPRVRGSGLAICRQIVALHGGAIHAESAGRGRGSTFVVRLPAASARGGSRAA